MTTRRSPAVAGQFYPANEKQCRAEISACLTERGITEEFSEKVVAGIIPHAGWTFSGSLAAMVFSAVKKTNQKVDTFVIFGAAHSRIGSSAAVYDSGSWLTPLGQIQVDEELAAEIISKSKSAKSEPEAHKYEHSIEVQIPFIQELFPEAKIVPILTAPADFAVHLGIEVAECIKLQAGKTVVCIGSTDLTHYGPKYGFNPKGNGQDAIEWAKQVNDKAFIELALAMRAEELLESSLDLGNSCGPGAAAAVIAAARASGKTKGRLLAHTHSNDVMKAKFGQTSNESVGYAAIVY